MMQKISLPMSFSPTSFSIHCDFLPGLLLCLLLNDDFLKPLIFLDLIGGFLPEGRTFSPSILSFICISGVLVYSVSAVYYGIIYFNTPVVLDLARESQVHLGPHPSLSTSLLSVSKDVLGSLCSFPVLALDLAISSRKSDHFTI